MKRAWKPGALEAHEADEGLAVHDLDGPQAKTVLAEGRLDAIDHAVRLGPAERRGEVLHDDGIGVERGEGLPVGLPPRPQEEALGAQLQVGPASLTWSRRRGVAHAEMVAHIAAAQVRGATAPAATSMSKAGTFIPPWGTITSA